MYIRLVGLVCLGALLILGVVGGGLGCVKQSASPEFEEYRESGMYSPVEEQEKEARSYKDINWDNTYEENVAVILSIGYTTLGKFGLFTFGDWEQLGYYKYFDIFNKNVEGDPFVTHNFKAKIDDVFFKNISIVYDKDKNRFLNYALRRPLDDVEEIIRTSLLKKYGDGYARIESRKPGFVYYKWTGTEEGTVTVIAEMYEDPRPDAEKPLLLMGIHYIHDARLDTYAARVMERVEEEEQAPKKSRKEQAEDFFQ